MSCNKVKSMKNTILNLAKALCALFLILVIIVCAILFQKHSLEITQWIDKLGWFAPVLFVLIYCLATVLLFPTMVLTLASGAIFGPLIGTVLNLLGATGGSALAFLITRHFLTAWVEKRKSQGVRRLIEGVNKRGWISVAILRLFPLVPFHLVNYGMGVTAIPFRLYVLTTFIFLIPAEIIYTYFGYAGMNALSNPSNFYKNGSMLLIGLGILFLIIIKLIKPKQLV